MFRKSTVSFGGRVIITMIFALTTFVPETLAILLILPRSPYPEFVLMTTTFRIVWSVILYYFTMLGHGWARWITALLLVMSAAMFICVTGRHVPVVALVATILYFLSIAALLGLKTVQPKDSTRPRRRRSHS